MLIAFIYSLILSSRFLKVQQPWSSPWKYVAQFNDYFVVPMQRPCFFSYGNDNMQHLS